MLGRAVTFSIRADLTGCPVVPTGSSGSLSGVDCKIPHRRVGSFLLALLVVRVLTCHMCFGASGSEVSSHHQQQNCEAVRPKADNIWQVRPGCYTWYQSRGRLVLRWRGIVISEASVQSQGLISRGEAGSGTTNLFMINRFILQVRYYG
jgi:hypothetical protein